MGSILENRDTGTAVGQGGSKRVEGNGNLYKTNKSLPICLLLFSNNIDLKNNNINCRKPF